MSIQKPGIPKGTRDFGPVETARRNLIFNTISNVFEKYGYVRIETPAMENLDTLLGKYGEEGDKLLFKILNSGDFLAGMRQNAFHANDSNSFSLNISEKGLRYDLTVPFARYVVQHQHDIVFPFKRYQIQPVWRADRPQKGRYREFYQCDADVIGSDSLFNELDLIKITDEVFEKLHIRVKIKLNNRKILAGIAEYIGYPDRITDITVALDKYEKTGLENVNQELKEKGIDSGAIQELERILFIHEENDLMKLQWLKTILKDTEAGIKGIEELSTLLNYCRKIQVTSAIDFDLTLARGLNYYTGAIIEVAAADVKIGSICAGGRYDDLTGIFGLKQLSGVGISFGADRIYDVMHQLDLFPQDTLMSSKVLFVNFGEKEALHCLGLLEILRDAEIEAELYPDPAKLKKQLAYAAARNIPFVALVGENEMSRSIVTLRNMLTGDQMEFPIEGLKEFLSPGTLDMPDTPHIPHP
ncbi:MAG: histidine--tRNA ligase [Bacteroidales bacterium]|nr:histidine--tRNA ligase [Bacteroidales bacterium]